jgi:hypothetical protein
MERYNYRIVRAGRYGGMPVTHLARLTGTSRWQVHRALKSFFSHSRYAGQEDDVRVIGLFLEWYFEYVREKPCSR